MKNRYSRGAVEAGGDHPIIVSIPNHVGVGIIGVEDWVAECPVTRVGNPGIGMEERTQTANLGNSPLGAIEPTGQ